MKKQPLPLLILITLLFCVFTLGFFFGRNRNHQTVQLSALPSQPRHSAAAVTVPAEESLPEAVVFPIDLNTADLYALSALPGIGETLAGRILEYRDLNGAFSRPEELLNVEGIGPGKLEAILDYVITGG